MFWENRLVKVNEADDSDFPGTDADVDVPISSAPVVPAIPVNPTKKVAEEISGVRDMVDMIANREFGSEKERNLIATATIKCKPTPLPSEVLALKKGKGPQTRTIGVIADTESSEFLRKLNENRGQAIRLVFKTDDAVVETIEIQGNYRMGKDHYIINGKRKEYPTNPKGGNLKLSVYLLEGTDGNEKSVAKEVTDTSSKGILGPSPTVGEEANDSSGIQEPSYPEGAKIIDRSISYADQLFDESMSTASSEKDEWGKIIIRYPVEIYGLFESQEGGQIFKELLVPENGRAILEDKSLRIRANIWTDYNILSDTLALKRQVSKIISGATARPKNTGNGTESKKLTKPVEQIGQRQQESEKINLEFEGEGLDKKVTEESKVQLVERINSVLNQGRPAVLTGSFMPTHARNARHTNRLKIEPGCKVDIKGLELIVSHDSRNIEKYNILESKIVV